MKDEKWYEDYKQVRTPDKERISKIVLKIKGADRTAADLAESTGLTPAMVSRIMNGKYAKPLTLDVLIKLAGEDVETMKELLSANGMISPEQQEKRNQRDVWAVRRNNMMERERNIVSIISNELFERGVLMRKLPTFLGGMRREETEAKLFTRRIPARFAVEMLDTNKPYKWYFTIISSTFDEGDTEEDIIRCIQMVVDRYSTIFLQDAWEPQTLKGTKISFTFCEKVYYDRFVEVMQDAKLHNRMSAVLVDIEEGKVMEEKSLVCSDFQDMSSPFSMPVIEEDTNENRGRQLFFFFDDDNNMHIPEE